MTPVWPVKIFQIGCVVFTLFYAKYKSKIIKIIIPLKINLVSVTDILSYIQINDIFFQRHLQNNTDYQISSIKKLDFFNFWGPI